MSSVTLVAPDTFVFEHGDTRLRFEGASERIVVPGGEDRAGRASSAVHAALQKHPGQIAVGALPFDIARSATLIVPERVSDAPAGAPEATPTQARVTPVPAPTAYLRAVAEATAAIAAGELNKVVLARMLVVQSEIPFDGASILSRLREREPNAYVFAVQGFIGATPELLVARRGRTVVSRPLAGTARRHADPALDNEAATSLASSPKDLAEHAFVVEAIVSALEPICSDVRVDGPHPVATGAMWHLGTRIEGTLQDPSMTSLDVAGLLHPTPAVCGTPTDSARAFIAGHEGFDRTLYAGLVGWQDASGDGEWAVALRCAEVREKIATLFAGAGIVAASDPERELAETDAKFDVMLRALGAR